MNKSWVTNNFIPALVWAAYHLLLVHWQISFLGLLMAVRAMVVFSCLVFREKPLASGSRVQTALAWFSTILPTLMIWQPQQPSFALAGELIAVSGMLLFIWTCVDLGKAFGVSPAIRSRVDGGIYRYLRNPMYASHIIVEVGILIASPSAGNLIVISGAWVLYLLRSRWEWKLWQKYLISSASSTSSALIPQPVNGPQVRRSAELASRIGQRESPDLLSIERQ